MLRFVYMQPVEVLQQNHSSGSAVLLMVLMGVTYSFGCLLGGTILVTCRPPITTSSECVIARRYFCQIATCACATSVMLFASVEEFTDRAMFAGIYGLLAGITQYAIDAFWRECRGAAVMTSCRPTPDYVTLAQVFPSLIGPPLVG